MTLFLIEFTAPQCDIESAPRVLVKEGRGGGSIVSCIRLNTKRLKNFFIKKCGWTMTKRVCHIFLPWFGQISRILRRKSFINIQPAGLRTGGRMILVFYLNVFMRNVKTISVIRCHWCLHHLLINCTVPKKSVFTKFATNALNLIWCTYWNIKVYIK